MSNVSRMALISVLNKLSPLYASAGNMPNKKAKERKRKRLKMNMELKRQGRTKQQRKRKQKDVQFRQVGK